MSKGFTNNEIPALSACESPIEGKFTQALLRCEALKVFDYYSPQDAKIGIAFFGSTNDVELDLKIQYSPAWAPGKRYDFLMTGWDDDRIESRLIVELDGEQYHSSADQRQGDMIRGRAAVANGIPIIRFTGSEVFRDPKAAALTACQCLIGMMRRNSSLIESANRAKFVCAQDHAVVLGSAN